MDNRCMTNTYQCTKFDQNISIYDRDMAKNRKFKIAAAMLNCTKSGTFDYCDPCIANIYQCTKFDENIFIYDRDIAKNRKCKIAAAAILNFAKSELLCGQYLSVYQM